MGGGEAEEEMWNGIMDGVVDTRFEAIYRRSVRGMGCQTQSCVVRGMY